MKKYIHFVYKKYSRAIVCFRNNSSDYISPRVEMAIPL